MKLCLKMTGCKNNRYELDQVILWCAKNDVELVDDEAKADFCVINTCTVTHVADRKSRQLIRKTKNQNPRLKTIVFGCAARMQKEEFEKIGEIDYLLEDVEGVINFLQKNLKKNKKIAFGSASASSARHRDEAQARREKNDFDANFSSRSRALVQIQDGCDNYCAYCIIAAARGRSKSRPAEDIINEINRHVRNGYNEVVLTGINIGAYGCKITTKPEQSKLAELLQTILDKTNIQRVRLSSIGPEYFNCCCCRDTLQCVPTATTIKILKNPRICRHIHLSVQSGSDSVLKRMRRRYTVKQMDEVIERLKKDIPGIAITTDIIVGFPEETDEEFQETVDFVKRHEFAKVHVFPYSIRKNTLAARMKQVLDDVKKKRAKKLQAIADKCRQKFIKSQVGKEVSVLWEKEVEPGVFEGLTDNYIRFRKRGNVPLCCITNETLHGQTEATTYR